MYNLKKLPFNVLTNSVNLKTLKGHDQRNVTLTIVSLKEV